MAVFPQGPFTPLPPLIGPQQTTDPESPLPPPSPKYLVLSFTLLYKIVSRIETARVPLIYSLRFVSEIGFFFYHGFIFFLVLFHTDFLNHYPPSN